MVRVGKIDWFGPVSTDTPPPAQPPLSSLAPGVPGRIPFFGLHQRVVTICRTFFETDLYSVDDGKPCRLRRLPEPGHPVEPVMVGNGQCLIPEIDGTLHQILGMRRSVEERKVSVAMEFGVTRHPSHYIEHMFDVFRHLPC